MQRRRRRGRARARGRSGRGRRRRAGRGRRIGRGCRIGRRSRSRGRSRSRSRSRRRGRRRRGLRRVGSHGEESQRVDVSLLLRRDADAEVDVGLRQLGLVGRADSPHRGALRDCQPLRDAYRPEVRHRHRVAARRLDRDDEAVVRDLPDEGHASGGGCPDVRAVLTGDVDAAVLTRGIGIRPERERPEHGAVRRPRPRAGRAREPERQQHDCHQERPPHPVPPRSQNCQRSAHGSG